MATDKDDEETMLHDTTPSKEENKEEDVPSEVSATNKRVVDEGSSKEKAKKKLVSVLEAPKNSKFGLREELGKVHGISRAQALILCKKMNEDDIVMFRDLQDEDEKYDLMMILDQV
ncbi:unnamed protein product [Amaranthus hypochondriacus]